MKTIVIAPHPDDEVLGAGGTMLRRKAEGGTVGWLVATGISEAQGWSTARVRQREEEMRSVQQLLGIDAVYQLGFPTTQLDRIPMGDLVSAISGVFQAFEPTEVLLPHPGDVHTDHRVMFTAVSSCTKWFRYPSIQRVLAYETLSETGFGLENSAVFRPNFYVNIGSYLDRKLQAMEIYASELGQHPFPRSHEAIRALATLRGASSGYAAAEAFEMLRARC